MPLDKIEYHKPVVKEPTRLQRFGELLATGGFSSMSPKPEPLSDLQREEIEAAGYSPDSVQPVIDWLERRGVAGEQAAATLRGAFNDLVERVNLQETPDSSTATS